MLELRSAWRQGDKQVRAALIDCRRSEAPIRYSGVVWYVGWTTRTEEIPSISRAPANLWYAAMKSRLPPPRIKCIQQLSHWPKCSTGTGPRSTIEFPNIEFLYRAPDSLPTARYDLNVAVAVIDQRAIRARWRIPCLPHLSLQPTGNEVQDLLVLLHRIHFLGPCGIRDAFCACIDLAWVIIITLTFLRSWSYF